MVTNKIVEKSIQGKTIFTLIFRPKDIKKIIDEGKLERKKSRPT